MQNLRVAVDVGGTFTDICIMDETTGLIRIEKTASSKDPIDAIMAGVDKAAIDLGKVALFSHGTTVATNALITRRLPRTAMVCTKGFRDVIEIRRANKEELWDTYKDVVKPYIPRRDRLVVAERVDAQGAIVTPLIVTPIAGLLAICSVAFVIISDGRRRRRNPDRKGRGLQQPEQQRDEQGRHPHRNQPNAL